MGFDLCRHEVTIAGRGFVLDAPMEPDELVRAGEAAGEPSPGYWAHVWPSAIMLAEHIADSSLIGKDVRVLEIGCGLGLVGIVAAWRGADVVMTDFNERAVEAARRNAALNRVGVRCEQFDWNTSPDPAWNPQVLLASDVLYVPGALDAVGRLIGLLGCLAVVADPGRPVSADAPDQFRERGLRCWAGPVQGGRILIVQE